MEFSFMLLRFNEGFIDLDSLDDVIKKFDSQIIACCPEEFSTLVMIDYTRSSMDELKKNIFSSFSSAGVRDDKLYTKESIYSYLANRVLYAVKKEEKNMAGTLTITKLKQDSYTKTLKQLQKWTNVIMFLPGDNVAFTQQSQEKTNNLVNLSDKKECILDKLVYLPADDPVSKEFFDVMVESELKLIMGIEKDFVLPKPNIQRKPNVGYRQI